MFYDSFFIAYAEAGKKCEKKIFRNVYCLVRPVPVKIRKIRLTIMIKAACSSGAISTLKNLIPTRPIINNMFTHIVLE
jgi:hypothetical protein